MNYSFLIIRPTFHSTASQLVVFFLHHAIPLQFVPVRPTGRTCEDVNNFTAVALLQVFETISCLFTGQQWLLLYQRMKMKNQGEYPDFISIGFGNSWTILANTWIH